MWFASLFSNEALISTSTVQLLHFSHLDFACTSPSSGLPARAVWREKSGQPKKPTSQLLQAEPCQSRAEVAQMGIQSGHLQDVLTPCSKWLLPVLWSFTAPWEGGFVVQAAHTPEPTGWDSRHTSSTHGAFTAHTGESTAQTNLWAGPCWGTPRWSERTGHIMAMPLGILNFLIRKWHGT